MFSVTPSAALVPLEEGTVPSGRQHELASAIFMIIRGSFMAIRVKIMV